MYFDFVVFLILLSFDQSYILFILIYYDGLSYIYMRMHLLNLYAHIYIYMSIYIYTYILSCIYNSHRIYFQLFASPNFILLPGDKILFRYLRFQSDKYCRNPTYRRRHKETNRKNRTKLFFNLRKIDNRIKWKNCGTSPH